VCPFRSASGGGALWTGFELQRFRRREGPHLDVAGQVCEDVILLWLRSPQFIWLCQREGHPMGVERLVIATHLVALQGL